VVIAPLVVLVLVQSGMHVMDQGYFR
jgi:hypothetical protein